MDPNTLIDGLIRYLGLVVLLTFHEFGHAWTAWKCGDDTAYNEGRVSLNPLEHIDPIGTVLLPLLVMLMPGAGSFIIGWARPVPVNLNNLRNPKADDVMITAAGPLMNLMLAIALMAAAKLGLLIHVAAMTNVCADYAGLSLLLCYFNLIPVPPLDGSRIMRVLVGMSYETYFQISRFGMLLLLLILQIPWLQKMLELVTESTFLVLAKIFGLLD